MEKLIKSINTRSFSIELIESAPDQFQIHWEHANDSFTTRPMHDLKAALEMFDNLLVQLEGN